MDPYAIPPNCGIQVQISPDYARIAEDSGSSEGRNGTHEENRETMKNSTDMRIEEILAALKALA
jgi:hypothetical protein